MLFSKVALLEAKKRLFLLRFGFGQRVAHRITIGHKHPHRAAYSTVAAGAAQIGSSHPRENGLAGLAAYALDLPRRVSRAATALIGPVSYTHLRAHET